MMEIEIVTNIDLLRQKSKEVSLLSFDKDYFIKMVKNSMKGTWSPGCGLAAIQLGIQLRVAYYEYGDEEVVLINPVIIKKSKKVRCVNEACLSLPYNYVTTERYKEITVKNGDGEIIEATGVEAQIIQHEIDHMDGILCIDRAYISKSIKRNDLCHCGSGKKYKKCCI